MSEPRQDRRTKLQRDSWGRPNVTYPFGKLGFPQIVETKTASNLLDLPDGLAPHPDAVNFPSAFLTGMTSSPGDNRDVNWELTYETLPGPIFVEVSEFQNTGIPILVAKQKIAAPDLYTEGEIVPGFSNAVIGISIANPTTIETQNPHGITKVGQWVEFQSTSSVPSIVGLQQVTAIISENEIQIAVHVTAAGGGGTIALVNKVTGIAVGATSTIVTFDQPHYMPPLAWVVFSGTNSTPVLDGNQRIVSVPAVNQLEIQTVITGSGSTGTMIALNRIIRELKPTGNLNTVMKVESMVGCPDVTAFNEDISAWKEYSWPDFLQAFHGYTDEAQVTTSGTEWAYTLSGGGSYGLKIQNGYRGPCKARRQRIFSVGPIANATIAEYNLTLIMPSSGTVVIESESISVQISSGGQSTANSFTFKCGTIPPVLTQGASSFILDSSGQAQFFVDLPASTPQSFSLGDTVTLMEQPNKLGVGLWDLYIWIVSCPYTMGGGAPSTLVYTPNPATYPSGTLITPSNPAWTGGEPSGYTVSPALPTGLLLSPTTGRISGTPAAPVAAADYSITGSNSFGSVIYALNITIT